MPGEARRPSELAPTSLEQAATDEWRPDDQARRAATRTADKGQLGPRRPRSTAKVARFPGT